LQTFFCSNDCATVLAAALLAVVPTVGASLLLIPAACDWEDLIGVIFARESLISGYNGCYNYEQVATDHYVNRTHAAHNHWCSCGWRGCSWGCPSNHGATYQQFSHTTYSYQHVLKTWLNRYDNTYDWGDDNYDNPGPGCVHKNSDNTTDACTRQCPADAAWDLDAAPSCAEDTTNSHCVWYRDNNYCSWHTWVQEQCPTTCCGLF